MVKKYLLFVNLKKLKSSNQLRSDQKTTPVLSKTFQWKSWQLVLYLLSSTLPNIFNDCVKSGNFPDNLKYADITPVYKKGDTTDKTNYRLIRTLSNFSKVLEKLPIYAKINSFIGPKLSRYLAGVRAKHNTQHGLLNLIEACRAMLNKGNNAGKIIANGSLQRIWHA